EVIAVGGDDYVEQRVGALVIGGRAGENLAGGGGELQRGAQGGGEPKRPAAHDDSLPPFRRKAEGGVTVAVAGAVDGAVERDDRGLVCAVVGFLVENLVEPLLHGEQSSAGDAVLADGADLDGARLGVAGDGDAELIGLEPLGLEARSVKVQS